MFGETIAATSIETWGSIKVYLIEICVQNKKIGSLLTYIYDRLKFSTAFVYTEDKW